MKARIVIAMLFLLALAAGALGREKFKDGDDEGYGSQNRKTYHYRSSSFGPGIEPTHYFYVPTSDVLRNREFVLSFHEWALGIDDNLQVFISPFASISGIFLGLKYGYSGDWAFGGGLAADRNWGRYYVVAPEYYYDRRGNVYVGTRYYYYYDDHDLGLGGFLSKSLSPAVHLAGSLRIWEDFLAMDLGIGGEKGVGRYTKLMFEMQGGVETYTFDETYLNLDGAIGIRYTVPSIPPLKISAGIGIGKVFPDVPRMNVWPYFDLSYGTRF